MALATGVDARNYVDISYSGGFSIDDTGRVYTQVTGIEAIKNVLKLYLFSVRGDYGRDFQKGGILFDCIGMQLTDANCKQIESIIKKNIEATFPTFIVQDITVAIDAPNRMFIVTLWFADRYNKYTNAQLTLGIKTEGTT